MTGLLGYCLLCRTDTEHVSITISAAILRSKHGEGPYEMSPTERAVVNPRQLMKSADTTKIRGFQRKTV